MADRPELPTQFLSSHGAYSVMPDERGARWTIWDLDGCIGEISWSDETWHSHPESPDIRPGEQDADHLIWEDAVAAVVAA